MQPRVPPKSIMTRSLPRTTLTSCAACICPTPFLRLTASRLEANASMFVGRMQEEHHGVHDVSIMRFENDTIASPDKKSHVHTSDVFLVLCLGDSLNEEVVVPMVLHKGRWLMR